MDCVAAGNLIVQLFMQTKPKYYLNNKKLQYLLCIAQMTGINRGIQLFEERIRNFKNNFALEAIADSFSCTLPIQEGITKRGAISLTHDDLVLPYACKSIYKVDQCVSESEKWLLKDVFIRFGAYSEKDLCVMLNTLKPLKSLPVWTYISNEELSAFFKGAGEVYGQNIIFRFCTEGGATVTEVNAASNMSAPQPVVKETRDIISEVPTEPVIVPEVAPTPVETVEEQADVPEYISILSKQLTTGLKEMVVGKHYSLYIEAPPQILLKNINIISLKDNLKITGNLKQINHGLYCYSFIGVASNIKISIDI